MFKEEQGVGLLGQNDQDIKRQEMSLTTQGLLSHGFYSKWEDIREYKDDSSKSTVFQRPCFSRLRALGMKWALTWPGFRTAMVQNSKTWRAERQLICFIWGTIGIYIGNKNSC